MMMKIAAGKIDEDPFDEQKKAELRSWIAKRLALPDRADEVAERQTFRLGLMGSILREVGDPDWDFVMGLGKGVPLGYDQQMPRTPAVFEPKTKWALDDPPFEGFRRPRTMAQCRIT